ncbi:Endoribonuclease L-PSP/chorismate mutase-like protein [Pelagophyceae sp. CCMP2097]|nr:Endoribonuclease L-PSP/chorismate mutase-like protein [Pelagophyceae sp. CCMP2097]|mmetsp:Transcript_8890/g.29363  ORF Transcript_8890/g.29363 Transcript_8890/m.29363 type:complete len:131 (-) Transcript_8890:125-517(-)|eukprot:CAMPEP_0184119276 /NCGR_PEP_ID=MMETSP0974-20121125/21867_1 /TAXON_ID=483370 /ORGANISM="non described non described, Strain CCMP2097" /LENGTH=130 /DNA_ID=CAMNT_0026422435 /DNA_START=41 /DNA_END=433 /DNA_ORIENTATION=+
MAAPSFERKIVGVGATPFYCKAQCYAGVCYASGQIGLVPGTKALAEGGITAQSKQAFENLKSVLEESGSDLSSCLKVTALLNDIADYNEFNKVWLEYFPDEAVRPARLCYGPGGLPFGALVEVDATAIMK